MIAANNEETLLMKNYFSANNVPISSLWLWIWVTLKYVKAMTYFRLLLQQTPQFFQDQNKALNYFKRQQQSEQNFVSIFTFCQIL